MNAKQTAPLLLTLPAIVAAAPAILVGSAIGCGIYYTLKWLFSDDEKKNPEAMPANTAANATAENQRKVAESTIKNPVFRQIPAAIPAKPAAVPVVSAPRAVIPPPAVQPVPKVSKPVPAPVVVPVPAIKAAVQVQVTPLPIKRKLVTREDMAAVFQQGARTLTRKAAAMALKRLGFGKTAAYAALTPDGRFATWLKFAPDGIITWTDTRTA
jgi:outer membrane biosynthesis protein TonB